MAILLTLTGSLVSCTAEKKEEEIGGNVPFKLCPDAGERLGVLSGEAYLFRDYIPLQMQILLFSPPRIVATIVLCGETDRVLFEIRSTTQEGQGIVGVTRAGGVICNFPDFAREWNICNNGIRVYYEGFKYRHSRIIPGDHSPFDLVLTALTKRL